MHAEQAYDHVFKIVLVGDSGVGKSALVHAFTDSGFSTSHVPTIGVDFKIRSVSIDGAAIKLHLWDTTGHDRFRAITTSYYRVAHGIVVVYDACNARSFERVSEWLGTVRQFASDGLTIALIGTKCDLADQRVVAREAAEALAAQHGVTHFEASALTPHVVSSAFEEIAVAIKRRQAELAVLRRKALRHAHASQWSALPTLPCRDDPISCSCIPPIFTSLFSSGPAWAPVASS